MKIWNSRSQKKWQKAYIDNVFSYINANQKKYSKIILNEPQLLSGKNTFFPKSLFKFYSPTSDNILDIKKRRLWLAHPSSFNDPFDCHTGYDATGYEKYLLLEYIKKAGFANLNNSLNGFTEEEYYSIYNAITEDDYNLIRNSEEYWTVIRNICESKSEDFQKKIYRLRQKFQKDVDIKIKKLRSLLQKYKSFWN